MRLLQRCLQCGATNCEVRLSFAGSFVKATITCPKQHKEAWCSQPLVEGKAFGNILFCSAILFSGSSPTKVIRLLSLMGVRTLQKTHFFKFQRCYLLPAVQEVWESEQNIMVQPSQGQKLCLAGDGRADSPGHSADFGTYTLMDVSRNRVFHIELVKSTEVSSSNRMEKEGLARAFNSFESKNVEVGMFVTDRHREVNAYLRDNYPDVLHRFDAWHFAKGMRLFNLYFYKKIDSVSGAKAHNVLRKWKRTIIRHLYWCARTSNGDGQLVLVKWKSIMRHVIDVHVHSDPLHPACVMAKSRTGTGCRKAQRPSGDWSLCLCQPTC
ncbi:unnamed protein product [Ixodes hexagonus]